MAFALSPAPQRACNHPRTLQERLTRLCVDMAARARLFGLRARPRPYPPPGSRKAKNASMDRATAPAVRSRQAGVFINSASF